MTPECTLQLASVDDVPAIAEMSRRHIEQGLGWSWTPARVMRSVLHRSTNVVVARRGAILLGFGIMEYGNETAHLVLLAVQPTHRRAGLGRRLVGWLEACARTAGIEKIRVEARADNKVALGFYRHLGYLARETALGYYGGAEDAVRMEKNLWPPA